MLTPYRFVDPYDWFRNELRKSFEPLERVLPGRHAAGVFPPVNLYDDGESFMIRAEMPGVKKEALDISAKGDQIVIRGDRTFETVDDAANFHRREREEGQFRRVVTLPQPINADKIMATYKDGILEIRAPRTEESRPRKITISG